MCVYESIMTGLYQAVEYTKIENCIKEIQKCYKLHEFLSTNRFIKIVEKISGYDEINVSFLDFSLINAQNAQAMLSIENTPKKIAKIVVNTAQSVKMQRFSTIHELGHLLVQPTGYEYEIPDDKKYTLSTHISDDITWITKEQCQNNNYLKAEQMANIFAILVLVPEEISIKKLTKQKKLVSKYGATIETLYSRLILSCYSY